MTELKISSLLEFRELSSQIKTYTFLDFQFYISISILFFIIFLELFYLYGKDK